MAGLWTQMKEQIVYLLKGPGSTASVSPLVALPPPIPPLRTSLVFESHIVTEAQGGKSRTPQTISSAWDERSQWSDTQQSWQGLTAQDRKTIMLDIYLNNSAASSCVDVISKRIFSGGVVVEKIDDDAPDNKRNYDTLMEFCLRVNDDWDFMQLGRALIQDKLIFGESYAEILWRGGVPWNLVKVDCIPMGYRANRWGQIEKFYQQLDSTRLKNWLDPQSIIRWWFPHPRASIDPFAPVEKVTDAVVIDKKMMVWMMTFFRQGAKFPYHIEGASDQDEADRLQTWFLQNVMGEKNAHKLPVTWGNAKIVPTGNAGALTMDFQTGMDRMDTMVYGAFGVPPAAVSIIKTGAMGGHSEAEQDKLLIYNACDPVKQAFFEKLNDRIVKRGFGITDYRISAHYADYRSDESVAKVEDIRIKNGSRTVDETRVEGGKRPYAEGGSVPFIWSTKEVVPLARLEDLEDEQKQTATVALQTAQANADLAQTKAKQAKEPPPEQQAPVPPAPDQDGKNAGNDGKQNNEPAKPDEQKQESYSATDMMIALMIPPEIGRQIALPGGEPVEDLHITLALLGDAADLRIEPELLADALKVWAAHTRSLAGRIAGVGQFDAPEGQLVPLIALPDIPGLPEFRQSLVHCLQSLRVDVDDTHGYAPHITLAYVADALQALPVLPHLDLFFDHICLATGAQRTFFPLLAQKQESYFTGKTELPQWVDPDEEELLANFAKQGVVSLTWEEGPNPCRMCFMNRGVTVKLGEPFPSGHRTPLVHPHCDCVVKEIYQAQEDEDDTQELPVVRRKVAEG